MEHMDVELQMTQRQVYHNLRRKVCLAAWESPISAVKSYKLIPLMFCSPLLHGNCCYWAT